ncbi:MAG: elongation factor P [Candidatus Fischerbacteria bacterium RBG_13_37_8]|uniref:Elongation factor P n=1 Tax=Candidatus Fischerbacteria bacterium RBG_13_37_8 TaxID=1817863 RepID=A0A1F5VV07_9BACT|nr:MAG: elongation factor P [Candidatus Fischerbacteria bacterium RBG_13_37_8]
MIDTSEFRSGLRVLFKDAPYEIVECQHIKPGKGQAFVRTRLKNIETGNVLEHNFRSGEKLPEAEIDEKYMQFLYREGDDFHFMDLETYEQVTVPANRMKRMADYLKEQIEVTILFYHNQAISIQLPFFVSMKVIRSEPGARGDTVTGGSKPVTLESGAVISVPLFINEGDVITIDTRTGAYIGRES